MALRYEAPIKAFVCVRVWGIIAPRVRDWMAKTSASLRVKKTSKVNTKIDSDHEALPGTAADSLAPNASEGVPDMDGGDAMSSFRH